MYKRLFFIFVFIFGISFVFGQCNDMDGGKIYEFQGIVSDNSGDYIDDCFCEVGSSLLPRTSSDSYFLEEYFCDGDNSGSEMHECPMSKWLL